MLSWTALITEPAMLALVGIAFVTALVRGFSGFGAGMLFMPLAGALFDPKLAIVMIWMIDSVPAFPILFPALKKCVWREIVPMAIAAFVGVPIGMYLLKTADPVPVRWTISLLTLVLAAILWSGWRYRVRPNMPTTLGVGFSSGFLGGFAAIPGPPVLMFWMSGPASAAVARANIIAYFGILMVLSGANLFAQGFITMESLQRSLILAPVYLAGVLIGNRMFGFASEATFRRIAYALIIVFALLGLPVLDSVLG
ncbi:hypothetical protein GGD81_002040 [Rhodobium orientis]|uniref:Probable membrane transporter protein n=2 Tax=Rhodobium orientis TaxID=34017 RepID=A0A327JTG5_9HYPH|nr:sulfite exporter TauE/SafE family protein [Rhodobium orientis]MBB4303002.1 hypothetical protein [Rhodobium orientis]MBK5949563.1 hypothetical protein [Rhodobium orientis]RAI29351.1 hypothetical protein CH339_03445 [Rhodobium orientis]